MAKITLTKAFIVRSRLLKRIKEAQSAALKDSRNAVINKTAGQTPSKVNFIDAYNEVCEMRSQLALLNTMIDAANAKGPHVCPRSVINQIEICKQELAFLTTAKMQKIDSFKPYEEEWNNYIYNPDTKVNGKMERIEFEYVGGGVDSQNPDEICGFYDGLIAKTKKTIEDLEDQLAELNNSTFIDLPFSV